MTTKFLQQIFFFIGATTVIGTLSLNAVEKSLETDKTRSEYLQQRDKNARIFIFEFELFFRDAVTMIQQLPTESTKDKFALLIAITNLVNLSDERIKYLSNEEEKLQALEEQAAQKKELREKFGTIPDTIQWNRTPYRDGLLLLKSLVEKNIESLVLTFIRSEISAISHTWGCMKCMTEDTPSQETDGQNNGLN